MVVLDYIVEFLGDPAFVLGLIALIGLIVLGKSGSDIVKGTLKVILGYFVLQIGVGYICTALVPLSTMFESAFSMQGIIPEDNSLVAAVQTFLGFETAMIMVFAFIINVIIARFSPWKYIFLTGHMMFSFAGTMAIVGHQLGMSSMMIILVGSLVQGVCQVLFPALSQPSVRKLTGSNDVALGFWVSSSIVLSAYAGGALAGKNSPSAEEMNVSEKLDFLKDMSILMSIVMLLVYTIVAIFAWDVAVSLAGSVQAVPMYIITNALTFVASVLVLLQGVRMFLGELVPAFKGFADKIVPNAIPALDIPVFYSYGPISTTIGFLTATVGAVIGMFITSWIAPVVVLPGMIGIFFSGGAAGVFGNARGGRRGAILSGFIFGLTWTLLIGFTYTLLDLSVYGISGLGFASSDAIIVSSIMRLIGMIFGV